MLSTRFFKLSAAISSLLMLSLLFALLSAFTSVSAHATESLERPDLSSFAAQQYATGPHIEVFLLHSKTTLVPGENIELGVLFMPEAQWHTYWRNPGDSGEAPTIKWQVEQALSFGDIQWPLPKAIPIAHLVNYGYEGANLLMVEVDIPEVIDRSMLNDKQELKITADVSWLVCKEDCIPGWATLSMHLPVAQSSEPSVHSELFEKTKTLLPSSQIKSGLFEITDNAVVFEVNGLSEQQWKLFPFRSDLVNHASTQNLIYSEDATRIIVPRSDYFNGKAQSLGWLMSDGKQGFYVNGVINAGAASDEAEASALSASQVLVFMLMAFAGGLILNLMPCVLPILSIKAMALHSTQQGLSHKLAYLFGVLFCFNLFAAIIVILQQSGQQVGWGFHMQEPAVVVVLAFLFTLIALVLLDALAVSSRLSNVGSSLVSGDSPGAHFATGTLAVIVASPCTAPFMAAALGVALVSEPYITFVLFNALAIGFALPLTLLFLSKKAMSYLPKPGPWMETFKHALAFPMFATVAWLCWVFAGQMGAQAQFALLLALILFCMFIWLLGRSSSGLGKTVNSAGVLASIALPIWLSVTGTLAVSNGAASANSALPFVEFNQNTLKQLRDDNQVVVVNMTADWCITCKVNEQVAFSSDEVRAALKQNNVNYMVGDWTNKNDEILQYLSQYERAGVPLYVIYAGNKNKQVLPQILTPNTVINAIKQAKEDL